MKDSLFVTIPKDSLTTQINHINNQFNKTNEIIGTGMVGVWFILGIFVLFVFKRPK